MTPDEIVETLTVARENSGEGQRTVAERAGVDQSTLWSWETYRRDRRKIPGLDKTVDWAAAVDHEVVVQPIGATDAAYRRGWADCAAAVTAALGDDWHGTDGITPT